MISIRGKLTRLSEGIHPDDYDFDHPNSLDFNAMYRCLVELIEGDETKTPVYCFKTHKQLPGQYKLLKSKEIIIFEGILCMHDERIRKLFDLKIFIHCDPDIALARRIRRDINERGRDVSEVLKRYNRFVKRDFDKYVKPQMKYVDFTIPGGASNDVAMNIIVQNLQSRLSGSNVKESIILHAEDQLRDALCVDLTKIASVAQLYCPSITQKYLINTYLGILQSDDLDFIKSNMVIVVNGLTKNALDLISTDLSQTISAPLGPEGAFFCCNYVQKRAVDEKEKIRFILFFETVCSNQTIDALIHQHKIHKGVPIYCVFIFIEEKDIEKLYKEIDLLKMICLYPQYRISYLTDIQIAFLGGCKINQIAEAGDSAIAERFGIEYK